ncbi:tyrosine-type recombinase/integrase [Methylobacterium sp. CM6241]
MPRRASDENVLKFAKGILGSLTTGSGQAERIVWDSDVPGFGLRLRASGNRAWVIRPPRSGGKSKLHTLGSFDAIDLATARRTAREKIAEATLGGDPTNSRRQARAQAVITLDGLIDVYVAHKEATGRRSSTISNLRHHLEVHWKPLRDRPLSSITRADVASRHREVANVSGGSAADRARSILSTFFVWAIGEGLVEANPVLNTNKATTPTRRDRVLNDSELAAVWQASTNDDFGRIVRLLILTGQRRTEVAGIRWNEIDAQAAMWTIPATRMKNRRGHEVPLSRASLSVLEDAPVRAGRELVFGDGVGAFSGFSRAKAAMDRRIGDAVGDWSLHDLRRTVSTGMNSIGVMPHIVEEVLSHVSSHKGGVAGNYNWAAYRPEKRDALDRWALQVLRLCL